MPTNPDYVSPAEREARVDRSLEIARRQMHVMEVQDAIRSRLAAVRTTQTVLDDLASRGVPSAHTSPCWVALEDELRWLAAAEDEVNAADGYPAAYEVVAFWSPEMIRRGVGPAPAPSPVVPL